MKKMAVSLMTVLLLFAFIPKQLQANNEPLPVAENSAMNVELAETEELLMRLDDINEMDKSLLIYSEKKELRKEVRSINKELKQRGGGIYLSVGGAIIIILLLILLL